MPAVHVAPPQSTVEFQYDGATAMTAIGTVTGRRYRFAFSQARLAVDARDAPSLAGVPHLRRRRAAG